MTAAAETAVTNALPWATLGGTIQKEHRFDLEAAMQENGLNVNYELVPLLTEDGMKVRAKAIRRTANKVITADSVGMIYHLLQPAEAFNFFTPFLENKLASLCTWGQLGKGKKIWMLAKIERDPIVLGKGEKDFVEKYVLLMTPYDGSTSVYVGFTPIYFTCSNTLALAMKDKAAQMIRVRHTKRMVGSLEAIQNVIDLADQQFSSTAEQYQNLIGKGINAKDLDKYVRKVFKLKGDKLNGQQQRILTTVTELFETGKSAKLDTNKGTMWGAYNAVTEFLSYKRGDTQDTRLTSLWFGASARTNAHALHTALQLAS